MIIVDNKLEPHRLTIWAMANLMSGIVRSFEENLSKAKALATISELKMIGNGVVSDKGSLWIYLLRGPQPDSEALHGMSAGIEIFQEDSVRVLFKTVVREMDENENAQDLVSEGLATLKKTASGIAAKLLMIGCVTLLCFTIGLTIPNSLFLTISVGIRSQTL